MKKYVPLFEEYLKEGRNTDAIADAQMDRYKKEGYPGEANTTVVGMCTIKYIGEDDSDHTILVKTPYFRKYFDDCSNSYEHPDGMIMAVYKTKDGMPVGYYNGFDNVDKSYWLGEDGYLYTLDYNKKPERID